MHVIFFTELRYSANTIREHYMGKNQTDYSLSLMQIKTYLCVWYKGWYVVISPCLQCITVHIFFKGKLSTIVIFNRVQKCKSVYFCVLCRTKHTFT